MRRMLRHISASLIALALSLPGQTLQMPDPPLKNWLAAPLWAPDHSSARPRPETTAAGATGQLSLVAITPCRLVDTRAAGGHTGAWGPPSLAPLPATRNFDLPSNPYCTGIPSTALAYSLNFTVIPPAGLGYLAGWPEGQPQPSVSILNDSSGTILANAAIVPAGTNGGITMAASNTTDLIIDINGYFVASTGGGGGGGGSGITAVNVGTGLTESQTGGAVTLNVDATQVPLLNASNNAFTGTINATSVNATSVTTTTGNITTTSGNIATISGNISGASVNSSGNISLYGNILDNGIVIYTEPYNPSNVAVGPGASAGSDTSGTGNTSTGAGAMSGNGGGSSNIPAVRPIPRAPHVNGSGVNPHPDTTSGGPTGSFNTAHGYQALSSLTGGYYNTAMGAAALTSNATSFGNTAVGFAALENTTNGANTATGSQALSGNTTGASNSAFGFEALYENATGSANTAVGSDAAENLTGSGNTAIGAFAMIDQTGSNSTAVGYGAAPQATGSNNIAIGAYAADALRTGSNNIHIGTYGTSTDNGVIRIGGNTALGDPATQTAFYASGIAGATVSGVPVLVNTSTGQLGVASSSRRFKEDIQDMSDASDGLMSLRPVTFRYKQPFDDGTKPVQYGLIAEEVAEVYPDLVARSADGQIETVKYQLLDPMLLNEVQKQQTEIGAQREQLQKLEQQVNEQRQLNQSLLARLAKLEATLASTSPASGGPGRR